MKTWIWKAKKEKGNRWYLGTIHQEWLQRRHLQFLCRKHLYTHGIVGTFGLSAGWSVIPLGLVCTYWPCSVKQCSGDMITSFPLLPIAFFISLSIWLNPTACNFTLLVHTPALFNFHFSETWSNFLRISKYFFHFIFHSIGGLVVWHHLSCLFVSFECWACFLLAYISFFLRLWLICYLSPAFSFYCWRRTMCGLSGLSVCL